LYRGDAGQGSLKSVRFNLPILLEKIAQLITNQSATKDLKIISYVDPSTPVWVKGDPDRLQRLMIILVGHALRSADHGEVSIRAVLGKETSSYMVVDFSISFIGTAAYVDRQRVIQKSLDDSGGATNLEFGGFDSGPSSVEQILPENGSTFRMTNTKENESKITFTLNFGRDTLQTANEPESELNGIRILLVEDNLTRLQALTKMLNAMGCRVKTITSGAEVHPALVRGAITNAPYRVVILNMEMQFMDVQSVLRSLREDDLTKSTKVIALMSSGYHKKLVDNSEFKYSHILLKPVRRSELRNVLESALALREDTHCEKDSKKTGKEEKSQHVDNLRILLVEDDELNLKMGSILLGHLGHTIDVAVSGADAVAKIESRDYDLVFMDVEMPLMNGLEATRRIRALQTDRKNVPIIAMTGHDMAKYEQLCLEAGMDGFISKPFNINHIKQILATHAGEDYRKDGKSIKTSKIITQPDEAQLLDVNAGLSIFNNDAILYKNYLNMFLEGLPKRIEKMVIALNSEEWEFLGNEAHNLKGISANLGAMKVSTLASRLEVRSNERMEEKAQSTLCEMEKAISELLNQAPSILFPFESFREIQLF